MTRVDLVPAALQLGELVRAVPDDRLQSPTPCPAYALGDLLDHVGSLGLAFTAAATKDLDDTVSAPPTPNASRLAPDWRTSIPRDLEAMALAWRRVLSFADVRPGSRGRRAAGAWLSRIRLGIASDPPR